MPSYVYGKARALKENAFVARELDMVLYIVLTSQKKKKGPKSPVSYLGFGKDNKKGAGGLFLFGKFWRKKNLAFFLGPRAIFASARFRTRSSCHAIWLFFRSRKGSQQV